MSGFWRHYYEDYGGEVCHRCMRPRDDPDANHIPESETPNMNGERN